MGCTGSDAMVSFCRCMLTGRGRGAARGRGGGYLCGIHVVYTCGIHGSC